MKKSKTMRVASGLLVLTLLSTCVVAGTFAKYTTEATGSDSARVAEWGLGTATVTMNDLFKNAYDSSDSATVKSTVDVMAPGTEGSAQFGFTANKAPEVAYTLTISTDGSVCADDIKKNSNIVWSLDGTAVGSWDQLLTSIQNLAKEGTSNEYAPGVLPTAFKNNAKHTVSWKWNFEDAAAGKIAASDKTDTDMGNKQTPDTVTLKITVTATQKD